MSTFRVYEKILAGNFNCSQSNEFCDAMCKHLEAKTLKYLEENYNNVEFEVEFESCHNTSGASHDLSVERLDDDYEDNLAPNPWQIENDLRYEVNRWAADFAQENEMNYEEDEEDNEEDEEDE